MSDQWSASLVQTAVAYLKERDGAVDESIGLIFAVLPQKEMELVYKAVTMVEKAVVTRMVASPSQRAFFQVTSTVCSRDSIDPNAISERKKVVNVCFEHFCTCYTFIHTTIKCPIAMCEHIIAVKLAEATKKVHVLQIRDTEYPALLLQECVGESLPTNTTSDPM
ncbi:hypothetical protein ABG067_001097 [Albugo candida]|uniref:SWIM-type domain-containing protein n=1 Tax=Albugo candida TaxID=65357 RepID=A0A024GB50_9STRA|nr:unnamed protein product [Albugo candida]|eukprot:CCI43770.1 unnamed protein product [Albugo candida]